MPDQKRLRADAERNRLRLLDAAAELFATKGLSVGLDEIAHHAGVGVGTAYRRFADKSQLIEELLDERVAGMVALAEHALAATDPWDGLASYLEHATELLVLNRGVREIVYGSEHATAFVDRARARVEPLIERLLDRAQASGAVRRDVVFSDMPLIQFMISAAADLTAPQAPELWRRYLALMIDGLRTPDPQPLPQPGLSPDELAASIRHAPAYAS
jgi:AcrR family transcriptional regulator